MDDLMTTHARARMQQRGISRDVVELVLDYGRRVHDHHGATVCFLDRTALRRAERDLGPRLLPRRGEAGRGVYVVLHTNGTVLTVGHRTRRVRLH